MTTDRVALRPATLLGDVAVAGMGLWQLWFTVCVRAGLTFNQLLFGLPVLVAAVAGTVWWVHRLDDDDPVAPTEPAPFPTLWAWLTGIPAVVSIAAWQASWIEFEWMWGVVLVHLLVLLPRTAGRMRWNTGFDSADALMLGTAMVAGCICALGIRRPEGDDAYYLAQAVATWENPTLPVLSFDPMHGDVTLPVQQVAHRAAGFETLTSVVTAMTGMHPFDVYYVLLPGIFGFLAPLGVWLTARAIGGRLVAGLAAMVSVVILIVWAGNYYTPGNFAYARMFQGKGVLVSVYIPLMVHRGLHFVSQPNARTWWMLLLAQAAAASCTSTALIVAPLGAGLVVLAGISFDKRGLAVAGAGLLSAVPVLLFLLLVKLDVDAAAAFPDAGLRRSLAQSHGLVGRAALATTALVITPALARWTRVKGADWLARYAFFTFLICVNEQTSVWIADLGGDLYRWRTYWAVPFSTIIAVMLGLFALRAVTDGAPKAGRVLSIMAIAWFMSFWGTSGVPTWSSRNNAAWDFLGWKIGPNELDVTQAIMDRATEDDLVLATEIAARRIPPWPNSPKMVAVRPMYSRHLTRAIGKAEASAQVRLLDFAAKPRAGGDVDWAIQQIDARCVTILVLNQKAYTRQPGVAKALTDIGFVKHRFGGGQASGYHLWFRDPGDCPPEAQRERILERAAGGGKKRRKSKRPRRPKQQPDADEDETDGADDEETDGEGDEETDDESSETDEETP